jgi:NAD(P)-dependent dehydrogenase (short-subunit alcohol dehydrogenase family)
MSQTVVVTGASAGVGRATAVAFASRGDRVGLLARGSAGLAGALAEVERAGGTGLAVETDVADHEAVEQAAATVEAQLGPIDVWVNNAMATVFAPFHEITAEEYRRSTEVTYLGTVYGTMAALRRMRARGAGTIVQVGSALAYRGIPLQSPYCGAKHAIQGFTEAVRCELLHDESPVHVTMVQMPALNTPQFGWSRNKMRKRPQPVPPIFQPEVAARAIVWASQHRRKEVYVGRSTVLAIVDEPDDDNRPDNLLEPVDAETDRGMHGRFDDKASDGDPETWFVTHRGLATAAAASAGAAAVTWLARRR